MLTSSIVIKESGVQFGTSGARGLVTQFTPEVCAAFAHAFIRVMKKDFSFSQLAIAIDNRPSSYDMAMACAKACQQAGIEPIYYGVIPTPALAYQAMQDNMPSIMVTGSHIPFDRNGLKFYRPDGEISKQDEVAILSENTQFEVVKTLPNIDVSDKAALAYVNRYISLFDENLLAGKKIGIYEHSSAGRDLYAGLFRKLGAEVIALERTDEFVPIDTEAVSEADQQKALAWSKAHSFDAIFSTDGDGDRPLIADENGHWLRGDILGLLCAKAINAQALAVPVSCNTAIESCGSFENVIRTRIGSPYVIAEFKKMAKTYKNIAGFEANGGVLLGSDIELNGQTLKALPTRDAVLPAIMLLGAAASSAISNLVSALPERITASDRIKNFATERSKEILAYGAKNTENLLKALGLVDCNIENVNTTDGLRITLTDNRIVHLRPSGNAPELRCYAEADCATVAEQLVTQCLSNIVNVKI